MEYKISKEFFGGIIKDKKNNLNIKLDAFTIDFIEMLENKYDKMLFLKKYIHEIESLDIIDMFRELVEVGLYRKNYELLSKKNRTEILSAPFRIFYDITYGCNLRCIHCFTESGEEADEELTLEEKKKFIDQCVCLGVGRISIAGGEPLFCKDLFPFLEYCKEKELGVSITTNGTLLTKENIQKLNQYSLKTITVSLDGASSKSCDFVRGMGKYKLIIDRKSVV